MDNNKNKQIESAIMAEMQKIRDNALLTGYNAMCGAVLQKAKDKKKSEPERLKDIIAFCERSLEVAKKHKED